MNRYLLLALCASVAALANNSNAVNPPDGPSSNNLVTSKATPTAEAPVFGTGSWFRRVMRAERPKVELQNPIRLGDFVVNDKIELSLRNYIELVVANNTDISIQRLSIEVPRNAILRGYSIFDPILQTGWTTSRNISPVTDFLQGVPVSEGASNTRLSQPFNLRVNQLLNTGTSYNVGFTTTRTSTNSQNPTFNPAYDSGMTIGLSQPLLRGRGSYYTRMPIMIARSRLRQSEYSIQDQVLRTVATAENAYWDVIAARENLRVAEQTLALSGAILKRAQRELELGAISELEIFQPQAQYANAEIQVTQSRFRLAQVEDALRRQISVDLDPKLRELPITLTEEVAPPVQAALDRDDLINKGLRQRPDLRAQRQALDVDDLTIDQSRNALKPLFNLTGNYASSGVGGVGRPRGFAPVPGGWFDSLEQLFGFGYPTYGFGFQLNLPLRDRRAAADYADAVVNKRLDALRVRSLEQSVRLEILNAINQVEQSKASVELARVALDLAQKSLDAEQKKFDLGTSVLFFLLQRQSDLSVAQSQLVNQTVNYRRNLTTLLRVTGDLLGERGITIQ